MTSDRARVNDPELRPLAFLVDLDGVLVHSHAAHVAAYERAFREHELRLEADARDLVTLGAGRDRVLARAGVPESVRAAVSDAKEAAFLDLLTDGALVPAKGAERFLRVLADEGCPAVLVSNSATAGACVDALELGWAFRAVVDAGSVARVKPDPEPFLVAAAFLGVRPERCVAVEDSPAGTSAARAAGAFVVGVGSRVEASEVDLLVDDLHEIPVVRWLHELPAAAGGDASGPRPGTSTADTREAPPSPSRPPDPERAP